MSDDPVFILQSVAELPPAKRIARLWEKFEHANDTQISRPPSRDELLRVQEWLRFNREDMILMGWRERRQLRMLASVSMTEKAGTLVQLACPACEVVTSEDGTIDLYRTFPVDVDPWSRQSSSQAAAMKSAVSTALQEHYEAEPYAGPICMTVAAVVPRGGPSSKRIDIDNAVKGLLDALNGLLYIDDSQIQCLSIRRVEYSGITGHYLVAARGVYDFDADVVLDDGAPAKILWGERVTCD